MRMATHAGIVMRRSDKMYDLIIKIAAVTERDWLTMNVPERLEWISAMHKELAKLTDEQEVLIGRLIRIGSVTPHD